MRIILVNFWVCLSIVAFCFLSCNNVDNDKRPNILLIFVDDLGYADLSIQGSEDCYTPNIDKLAKEGIQFDQAYVTAPQCSPSRAGLMTGRYQNRFGHEANAELPFVEKFGLDPHQKTFARFMKDAGYKTYCFGKWDLGSIPSARPWKRGFDYFFGHYAGARSFDCEKQNSEYAKLRKHPNDKFTYKGYLTDVITDDAIGQLNREYGKPWFAYMSYLTPHWPMEAKQSDLAKHPMTDDLHRRAFLAMMSNLDQNVGKLLSHLERTGQTNNTMVIFLSDNGGPTGKKRDDPAAEFEYGMNTSLNHPFKGVKGDLFEGGIRTPLFIKWPEQFEPQSYPHPVISMDLLPTCLAIAEGDLDRKLDGKNLMPFLKGENTAKPHQTLYWRWFNKWAIRHNKWKLLIVNHDNRYLYNLEKDPYETTNLINEHPKTYKHLLSSLKKWNSELKPADWRYPEQVKILSRQLQ